VAIFSRLDLCPLCEGAQLQPTGGTELKVVDMRVV
jgi:hydrogenase nickel incorporation protein HypA/HybF